MRADALIRIRVADRIKREWSAHADAHGIGLSDFVRTACRLGSLIGYQRLADGLTDIACARRDLHTIADELRRIALDHPQLSAEDIRSALARIHMTTDALSAVIRGKPA